MTQTQEKTGKAEFINPEPETVCADFRPVIGWIYSGGVSLQNKWPDSEISTAAEWSLCCAGDPGPEIVSSGAVRGCLVILSRPGAYWLHRGDLRERHVSVSTYQEEALAN